jgi:5'-phosphate synthase pdxT subunit
VAGKRVGILALQGDVALHVAALQQFDVIVSAVKMPDQLAKIDALIIPGGESTALLKLAEPIGMLRAITDFAQAGGHILGTCAGAILLARSVTHPAQKSLGLIDIVVERNGYGRQINSTEALGEAVPSLAKGRLPMTFIRAPRIKSVGNSVSILATHDKEPVLVEHTNILAATFHPELTDDQTVYDYWINKL